MNFSKCFLSSSSSLWEYLTRLLFVVTDSSLLSGSLQSSWSVCGMNSSSSTSWGSTRRFFGWYIGVCPEFECHWVGHYLNHFAYYKRYLGLLFCWMKCHPWIPLSSLVLSFFTAQSILYLRVGFWKFFCVFLQKIRSWSHLLAVAHQVSKIVFDFWSLCVYFGNKGLSY